MRKICRLGMMWVWVNFGSTTIANADTVVHDTSAEFAAGTFVDTEDTGNGGSPAIRTAYDFPLGFGDGSDGPLTISSSVTDTPVDSPCEGAAGTNTLTVANTDGFSAGDWVMIHQSRGTDAGSWELAQVASVASEGSLPMSASFGTKPATPLLIASGTLPNIVDNNNSTTCAVIGETSTQFFFVVDLGVPTHVEKVTLKALRQCTGQDVGWSIRYSLSSLDSSNMGVTLGSDFSVNTTPTDYTQQVGTPVLARYVGVARGGNWGGCNITLADFVVYTRPGSLTLTGNLQHTYTDAGPSQAQVLKVNQYSNVTVNAGVTWSTKEWNGNVGGILPIVANGTVTINGIISAQDAGYRGGATYSPEPGAAFQGEGTTGQGVQSTAANGNGGGGHYHASGTTHPGSGGGGHATAGTAGQAAQHGQGTPGSGGNASGSGDLSTMVFGGASGGTRGASRGMHGGGIIVIYGRTITVGASGRINTNGTNGFDVGGGNGAPGGSAGGSCFIRTHIATLGTGLVSATGSVGGNDANQTGGDGGNGSAGRIRVDAGTGGVAGSTNPAAFATSLQFKTTGQYLSSAIPTTGAASYGTLLWTASGGASVQFRTRTASSAGGLTSAPWSSYLVASGSQITSSPADWIQYEASLTGTAFDSPVLSSVTINYAINSRPSDPVYTAPNNGSSLNVNNPLLTWNPSTDMDLDPITYFVTISTNSDLSSPLVDHASIGANTQYQTASLGEGTWYWQVQAWDTKDYNLNSVTWSFIVDTLPPGTLSLTSVTWDLSSSRITKLLGSGDDGTTLTFYDLSDSLRIGTSAWDGNGNFTFTPFSPLEAGSGIYVIATDAAQNTTRSDTHVLNFENVRNVFLDTTTFHGSGPGRSLRLEGRTDHSFKLAVNGGTLVTVSAWLRKSAAYGTGGTEPMITLSGLAVNDAASMSSGTPAGSWVQLSVSGTPSAAGVLKLTVETFSTNSGAAVWIDDTAVSQ